MATQTRLLTPQHPTFHLDPRIRVIFVHPGKTQAEMLAENLIKYLQTSTITNVTIPVELIVRRSA